MPGTPRNYTSNNKKRALVMSTSSNVRIFDSNNLTKSLEYGDNHEEQDIKQKV